MGGSLLSESKGKATVDSDCSSGDVFVCRCVELLFRDGRLLLQDMLMEDKDALAVAGPLAADCPQCSVQGMSGWHHKMHSSGRHSLLHAVVLDAAATVGPGSDLTVTESDV